MGKRKTDWEVTHGEKAGEGAAKLWVLDDTPFHGAHKDTSLRRKGRKEMHLPMWLEQSEEWPEITPGRFIDLRTLVHFISVEQCAALLRVSPLTVRRWESGESPIPFAAYMALRLLNDVRYLPHQVKAWDGWKIINAGPDVGMLYDEGKSCEMFSPADLRQSRWVRGERDVWKRKAEAAEAKAAELEAENTRLRQMFNAAGITADLRRLHEETASLLKRIATAEVIEHRQAATAPKPRKAA